MRACILLLISTLALTGCGSRLNTQRELLVGIKSKPAPAPQHNDVRITYLGTNGYLLQSNDTSIVIDPFFSRIALGKVILNTAYSSSPALVAKGTQLAHFPNHIDAWLLITTLTT